MLEQLCGDPLVNMALRNFLDELKKWKKAGGPSTCVFLIPELREGVVGEEIIVAINGELEDVAGRLALTTTQHFGNAMAKRHQG